MLEFVNENSSGQELVVFVCSWLSVLECLLSKNSNSRADSERHSIISKVKFKNPAACHKMLAFSKITLTCHNIMQQHKLGGTSAADCPQTAKHAHRLGEIWHLHSRLKQIHSQTNIRYCKLWGLLWAPVQNSLKFDTSTLATITRSKAFSTKLFRR